MKNFITLSIISIITTLTFVACSAKTSGPESHSGTMHNKNLTQEKVHNIIIKAGEEDGWKMTEFKSNTVIAEKMNGSVSKSVTITFDKSSFDISPPDSDLADAIGDALE